MTSKLDGEEAQIQAWVNEGRTNTWIADRLKVSRSTVSDFRRANDIKDPAPATIDVAPDDEVSELDKLRAELTELKRANTKLHKTSVMDERILEAVTDAVNSPPPSGYSPVAVAAPSDRRHVHNLLFSDLHGGERVDPEQVHGMNEYSWEILEGRVEHVFRALSSFQKTRAYDIDTIVVSMLGDMVSGAIHEEIENTNQFPVAQQSYKVGILMGQFVESLLELYPNVELYCVPGNHGRLKHPPAAKDAFNNFDWLAYKFAEEYTRNHETVKWVVSKGKSLVAPIAETNQLLIHGDGVRSNMPGVPWGGVMRRANELRKQHMSQGVVLDGIQFGHFHQANVLSEGLVGNGSIKGGDEWTLANFGNLPAPEQVLLTFDQDKGRKTDVSYINP